MSVNFSKLSEGYNRGELIPDRYLEGSFKGRRNGREEKRRGRVKTYI